MKTTSQFKISRQSIFGVAALLVVSGIVIGLSGSGWGSVALVGLGIVLGGFAAFREGHLTIW